MAKGSPVILDTCGLLWLATGSKKLSRFALDRIQASPFVYVSAISGFEIALKVAKGKLKLPSPPLEWFTAIVEHHGLSVLPLELDICIAAAQLEPVHDDPCDRFIIAIAKANGWAVITADERFQEYGITTIN